VTEGRFGNESTAHLVLSRNGEAPPAASQRIELVGLASEIPIKWLAGFFVFDLRRVQCVRFILVELWCVVLPGSPYSAR
jgi:hypothetical protein